MSRPILRISGAAAVAIVAAPRPAQQDSGKVASFVKPPPPAGLVGVWLDAESRIKVVARYPRLAGAPAVLLQSHSFAGVDAFEPLYGARAACTVEGAASGNEADAVDFRMYNQ